MTEKVINNNIKRAWEHYSHASLINDAKLWYPEMRDYVENLAKDNNLDVAQTSGIFSSLSPQKSVSENKRLAESFLKGKRTGHYKNQIKKAENILYTENADEIEKILRGMKTISFFRNILDPKDNNYCTIDTHLIKLCNKGEILQITPRRYRIMSDCVKKHAKKVNLRVSECQATLWIISKQLYGINV